MPRPTRLFLQLQLDYADDDKVARLARYGRDARAIRDLLVQMWCYCKREKSDGEVPAEIVGKLVYPDTPRNGIRDADRLVEVGIARHIEGGYLLAGYLKHNKSKAQIEAESIEKAKAGAKGGKASGEARAKEAESKQSASDNTEQGASDKRTHSTEDIGQSSDFKVHPELSLVSPRNETLPATLATKRPKCSTHPDGDGDERCGGCRAVRLWDERIAAERRDEARRARETCPDCLGDVWLENGKKCTHPKTRRAS